jgi:glycosyltransferase involved in cell wall biosynthesis
MMVTPYDPAKRRTVYGAHVVLSDLPVQLARHGRLDAYHYYASPTSVPQAREVLQGLPRVSLLPHLKLLDGAPSFSVWHAPIAEGFTPFHLRRVLRQRVFPITVTHCTVSYRSMLNDTFLPLLLADVRPFDALLCLTTKAREACRRLLEQTAEAFNAAHGTRLRWKGRLEIIPYGVDTDIFKPRERGELRRLFNLPEKATLLLWFGRISAMEKADLVPLLRVFERVVARNPGRELALVIAGVATPGDAAALRGFVSWRKLGDRVVFLTSVEPRVRHLLHASADIFVSPVDSPQEALGLTPIEALACGVPQVVSDWDGYTDTVEDGVTGFRVRTIWARCDEDARDASYLGKTLWDHLILGQSVAIDLAQLERSLQALIENEDLRRRMGEASRARALRLFDWRVVTRAHEELWAELVSQVDDADPATVPAQPYDAPRFFDAFSGFATSCLSHDAQLRLTASGEALIAGDESIPDALAPEATALVRDTRILECTLALLRSREATTLAALERATSARLGCPEHRARRHILWLLKYGYIELATQLP